MNCTQCGRALDAQALELGACRYCGHAIISAGTINISPADATGAGNPPTGAASLFDAAQSRYDWKDWPTASVPPPGATSSTLPKVAGFPESLELGGTTSSDALTLPGSRSFTSQLEVPPGTAPFGVGTPPLPGTPPSGASASPGPPAPQPFFATPASGVSTPPRRPPGAPGRRGRGRLLALVGLLTIALMILISGGVLLARSFNKPSSSASSTSVVSTAPATATLTTRPSGTPTAQPSGTPTAQPFGTSTPAPTAAPTPMLPNVYYDPNGLFAIGYPNGWTHRNISIPVRLSFPLNGVQFSSGMAELTVATGKELPGTPSDIATRADDLLLVWQGVNPPSSSQMVTIGGRHWTEKMGDSITGDHIVVASISLNGYLYSLIYGAPINEFASDNTQAFTPMIASFKFGS